VPEMVRPSGSFCASVITYVFGKSCLVHFSIVEMIAEEILVHDDDVYDQNSPNWQHDFLRFITLNI
jgi:hypothetical protein